MHKSKKSVALTLPSSSSWRVSTPYLGSRSPEKEFACRSGFLTPWICDMDTSLTAVPAALLDVEVVEGTAATAEASWTAEEDGPLDRLRSFLFGGRSPSSTLRLGMSSSCCWSVRGEKNTRMRRGRQLNCTYTHHKPIQREDKGVEPFINNM